MLPCAAPRTVARPGRGDLAARVSAVIPRRRRAPPAPSAAPPVPPGTGANAPSRTWRVRAAAVLRRHWLASAFLAAGLVLRALSWIAYSPALIYVDTLKYLYGVYPGADPLGYEALLKAVLPAGGLAAVAFAQNLLGLAMAVVLYTVLLRRGVTRWLAAVAVAPVLLDAYQLQMEQTIMPDVCFEAMVVAGLALLLWQPAVTMTFAAGAGLILGSSATVKALGEVLILPAVVYLLAAGGGWRQAARRVAAFALAFALPVLGYCGVSYVQTGHFWLARGQSNSGRLAAAADCATLKLPAAVRSLCPTPGQQAQGPDWLEHSGASPLQANAIPPGTQRSTLIAEFDAAVEHQQPVRVVASIARDSVRLFAVTRTPTAGVVPLSRWQFQTRYPTYPPWVTVGPGSMIVVGLQRRAFGTFRLRALNPSYGGPARVDRPVAAFLRTYQIRGGYTPGPLLALFALAGLAGSVLALLRRARGARSRQLALACLLFTAAALVVLLVPDVLEFSWRYQLPALVTFPPAGVLGVTAALSSLRTSRESRGERLISMSDVAWLPGPAPRSAVG
jgi:hypothetical protein